MAQVVEVNSCARHRMAARCDANHGDLFQDLLGARKELRKEHGDIALLVFHGWRVHISKRCFHQCIWLVQLIETDTCRPTMLPVSKG